MAERQTASGFPLLLVALALLAAGGAWLLSRTMVQDIQHPAYSTLNDTPEGASVLYTALSHTRLEVQRLYEADRFPAGAALFRIGGPLHAEALEGIAASAEEAAFVAGGGRLVCAFAGWRSAGDRETAPCADAATNRLAASVHRATQGVTLGVLTNFASRVQSGHSAANVPWYSVGVFELRSAATNRWRTLYALDGHPVLIETRFGKGSIVLATDCYFLSNEGLAKDARPALLSALVGEAHAVLFDETLHGLRETHNTAWLMRRYHLYGLVAVLGLLFLLALWQHACPLLPQVREDAAAAPQTGFRIEDGRVSLLRGHLPAARLPRHLFEAWRQTATRADAPACREMEALLETAEALRRPPVETCRALYDRVRKKTQPTRRATAHTPASNASKGEHT